MLCAFVLSLHSNIATSSTGAFNKTKCLKVHPYQLNEGASLCSTITELKNTFANITEEKIYRNEADWKNQDVSTALFYTAFPSLKDISHIEYKISQDHRDIYLPIKTIGSSNFVRTNITIRKLPEHNIPYEIINSTKSTGDFFDYKKYYNQLVALNGKPNELNHKDNELRPRKQLRHWKRTHGADYAENNKYWTYLDACWGPCMPVGHEPHIRFMCKKEDKCMIFEYGSYHTNGSRKHTINTKIYNPKAHPHKSQFWQRGKYDNKSTRNYLKNK